MPAEQPRLTPLQAVQQAQAGVFEAVNRLDERARDTYLDILTIAVAKLHADRLARKRPDDRL